MSPVAPPTHAEHHVDIKLRQKRSQDVQLRIADAITRAAGSMPVVYVHVVVFAAWMHFAESSPWPTLTLVASLEAIFLSTFVTVDLDNGVITVRRQLVEVNGRAVEGKPKTRSGEDRRVDIGQRTIAALLGHRLWQDLERLEWGTACVGSSRVFTREDGTDLIPSSSSSSSTTWSSMPLSARSSCTTSATVPPV